MNFAIIYNYLLFLVRFIFPFPIRHIFPCNQYQFQLCMLYFLFDVNLRKLTSFAIISNYGICSQLANRLYSRSPCPFSRICLCNLGGGPRVVVSTAAFHARVRDSVPGLGGLKETKKVSSPSTCESQYCGEPP